MRYASGLGRPERSGAPRGSGSVPPSQPRPSVAQPAPASHAPPTATSLSAPSSGQNRRVSSGSARPSQDLSRSAPRVDKGK